MQKTTDICCSFPGDSGWLRGSAGLRRAPPPELPLTKASPESWKLPRSAGRDRKSMKRKINMCISLWSFIYIYIYITALIYINFIIAIVYIIDMIRCLSKWDCLGKLVCNVGIQVFGWSWFAAIVPSNPPTAQPKQIVCSYPLVMTNIAMENDNL